jgi:hypothetical protein
MHVIASTAFLEREISDILINSSLAIEYLTQFNMMQNYEQAMIACI